MRLRDGRTGAHDVRMRSIGRMLRRAQRFQMAVVVLCAAASVVVVSCAAKDTAPFVSTSATAPNIVLGSAISAARAGSPQRAMLSWVQAVQFRDVDGVLELTAPASVSRNGAAAIKRAVLTIGMTFARPQVVDVRIRRDQAFVRVLLLSYNAGNPEPVLAIPATLTLVRNAGAWRMRDIGLLFPKGAPARPRRGSLAGRPQKR